MTFPQLATLKGFSMSLIAGIKYGSGSCQSTYQTACSSAGFTPYNGGQCYSGTASSQTPYPCFISTAGKAYTLANGDLSPNCWTVGAGTTQTVQCSSLTETYFSALAEGELNTLVLSIIFLVVLVIGFRVIYKTFFV